MATFWSSLDPVKIRIRSNLRPSMIGEDSDETMTVFIEESIADNGAHVRKIIDNAAGPYSFTDEGFSVEDLAALFPAKVQSGKHITEGQSINNLAAQAVRWRVLFDLESRNKGNGSEQTGTSNEKAVSYIIQAREIEKGIVESIAEALEGPDRGTDDSVHHSPESGSVDVVFTW